MRTCAARSGGADRGLTSRWRHISREAWLKPHSHSRAFALALTLAGLLAVTPHAAFAQRPVTAADSLRLRLDSLRLTVDSLRAALARMQAPADTSDALARVRAAAAAAAAAGADTVATRPEEQTQFIGRQRNLSALNPEISVTGDVFAFSRTEQSGSDNFVPREFEFSFVSNLDPFSRAKIFVAHHVHGGEVEPFAGEEGEEHEEAHGGEVEIEEGYVEWVNLPGGIGLAVGKFRQRFGRLNRWHAHALPAQQYPLPYLTFLGEEGLAQAGVSLHWLAPIHGAGTYEFWGELTRSSSEVMFGESNGLSALGHVNAFWTLSPASYLELGLSGITGDLENEGLPGATANRLFGADFTFDWRPPAQARYRQFTLHSGVALNRRVLDELPDRDAWGAFAIAELKFATQWTAGGRWEYVENPDAPDESAWLASPSLTWWQSEFVRLRAEYDVFRGPAERFGQFVLQATFAMGPHKHENY
jgi:hypothetical protein